MTTSTSSTAPTVSPAAMEEGRGGAPNTAGTVPTRTSCCSGRRYCCPTILSAVGGVANCVSIASTAVMLLDPKPAVLDVAITFNVASLLIHVIEGIVACILQPRKALEDTVEAAGKAGVDVGRQIQDLKEELQSAQALSKRQEGQLEVQRVLTQTSKEVVDEKITQMADLTQRLEQANRSLTDAQHIATLWKQTTEQVTSQVASLHPDKLGKDVERISAQMQQLTLSKTALGDGVSQIGADTAALQETQMTVGKMVDVFQQTLQGLTVLAIDKKQLLDQANAQIQTLTQRVTNLQGVDHRLADLTPKYEALVKDLTEARRQLTELKPILESPAFRVLLEGFATQKKTS